MARKHHLKLLRKSKAKIIKALSPPKSKKAWVKWLKSGEVAYDKS